MVKGSLYISLVVPELTVEHFFGDTKHIVDIIAQEAATGRQALYRLVELPSLLLRLRDPLERSVRGAFGVMMHRRGYGIEVGFRRQWLGHDVVPTPEANQDVHVHRVVALGRHGELRPALHGYHLPRDQPSQLAGRFQGRSVLAEKHADEHQQMDVVATRSEVKIEATVVV